MFIYSIFWGEISQIWFTPSNCWGNGLKPTVYINDSLVYSGIPKLKNKLGKMLTINKKYYI